MAKAKALPSVDTWPTEGLPIRVVCEQNAGALWDTYLACEQNVARDLDDLRRFVSGSASRVWPRPAEKHHLAAYKDAQATLAAWFRGYLEQQVEFELSARPGSRIAERERIPASAIGDLEFDLKRGTASGEGLPLLYDVRVHRGRLPASTVEPEQRRKVGARPQFDWDAIQAWCSRRFDALGFPNNVSAFCRDEVLPWCTKQFGDAGTPDMETLRPRVSGWTDAWQRSLPRE
jgi:hypothetical protein